MSITTHTKITGLIRTTTLKTANTHRTTPVNHRLHPERLTGSKLGTKMTTDLQTNRNNNNRCERIMCNNRNWSTCGRRLTNNPLTCWSAKTNSHC